MAFKPLRPTYSIPQGVDQFVLLADGSEKVPNLPKDRSYADYQLLKKDWDRLEVIVTHRSFGCANPRESDMQIRKSLKGDDYFKQYRPLTAIVENHGECAIPFGNPRDPAHSNL